MLKYYKGRKAEVLDRYCKSIGEESCQKIESVTLDGAPKRE